MAAIDAGLAAVDGEADRRLARRRSRRSSKRPRRAGTVLMCGLLERFNPAVRTAAEIARDPLHVSTVRHSPYAERIRTGVASDLLIHDIDLVVRLMGEATLASLRPLRLLRTTQRPPAAKTSPRPRCGSADGQIAALSVSRIAQHKIRSLTIAELGRVIDVDLVRQSITIYRHVPGAGFDEDAGYSQQTIIEIPDRASSGRAVAAAAGSLRRLIEGTSRCRRRARFVAAASRG